VAHLETLELVSWRQPLSVYAGDKRSPRPDPEESQQFVDARPISLGHNLDALVPAVTSVPGHTQLAGTLRGIVTKADALHPPMDYGVQANLYRHLIPSAMSLIISRVGRDAKKAQAGL
jgi:hypothetical protein